MKSDNKEKRELFSIMSSCTLHACIHDFARCVKNSNSCIDNIFTNVNVEGGNVFENHVSDHMAQKVVFYLTKTEQEVPRLSRVYGDSAKRDFFLLLKEISWENVYQLPSGNVDHQ